MSNFWDFGCSDGQESVGLTRQAEPVFGVWSIFCILPVPHFPNIAATLRLSHGLSHGYIWMIVPSKAPFKCLTSV